MRKKTDVRRKAEGRYTPFLPFPNEIVKVEGRGRVLPPPPHRFLSDSFGPLPLLFVFHSGLCF